MSKSSSLATIDLAKFIFSFLVVAIHTLPLYQVSLLANSILVQYIARYAVPFFFITSGYFIAQKQTDSFNFKSIFNQLKSLLIIYALWSCIYFPFQSRNVYQNLFKTINLDAIQEYFFRATYIGSYFHLWYFVALIQAIILYRFLIQYLKIKTLIRIFTFIYLFGLLGDGYYYLNSYLHTSEIILFIREHLGGTRNGFFMGTIFVMIGAKIATIEISKINTTKLWLLFIGFTLAHLLEVIFIKKYSLGKDYNMALFLLPASTFLFILILKSELKFNFSTIKLRQYSTYIYCFHPLAIILGSAFAFNNNSLVRYFFVLGVSIIAAIIITESQKKIKLFLSKD